MRVFCAWCGTVIEEGGPDSDVSHATCENCVVLLTTGGSDSGGPHHALYLETGFAAGVETSVLISGESDGENERVARLVHQQSRRRQAPLISVMCKGVPDPVLDSRIFGHAAGDPAGAPAREPGAVDLAHEGTLVLIGIEDLSLHMQAGLNEFLQTQVSTRTLEGASRRVDVRVIATADFSLPEKIAMQRFRSDLFYRLNVVHLAVPPLPEP